MGMHFGVLAARSSWAALLDALRQYTGDFIDRGAVSRIDEYSLDPTDDGFPILAGEYAESAFILDSSMLLSVGEYDRLVALSEKLGCVIGACVGETVSGTFHLFIAEKGHLKRLYAHCLSDWQAPFQMGDPWPTESQTPLDDIDGSGLFAALKAAGLDFPGWHERGSKHGYLYTCEELQFSTSGAKGPITTALDEHHRRFQIPGGQVAAPTVVARRLSDGSIGYDIVSGQPSGSRPRKSLFGMIRSWFGRN